MHGCSPLAMMCITDLFVFLNCSDLYHIQQPVSSYGRTWFLMVRSGVWLQGERFRRDGCD